MNNISKAFQGRKALIPFVTCGDPAMEDTARILREAGANGADMLVLGIPFSDPTAEGPEIQKIWKDPLMGYSVAIEHSGNAVTVYKNLSETLSDGIFEGATVKAGRQIGTVGESAMIEIADEPHLHLEMTVGGLQVDPLEYFSASDLKKLENDNAYEG